MLNGAAELYFAQRWSVEANALYSKWPTFNKKSSGAYAHEVKISVKGEIPCNLFKLRAI